MAGVPDRPRGPGPTHEPEYEVIGGVIDDQPSGFDRTSPRTGSPGRPAPQFGTDLAVAWHSARTSFTSWRFWVACALGIAAAWGSAAAVIAVGEANGWFDVRVPGAIYLITAVFLALAAAVLGAMWGFRHSHGRVPVLLLSGAMRGMALAALAGGVLLTVGSSVGGPTALTGAAVVVIVLEVAVFGLIGAGARTCFATAAPGAALAAVVVAFLCLGNVVVTALLLPGTTGMDQASVPVNVERDGAGRVIAYECVGELQPVEVAHTDRVVWLATANPALLLGSIGADMVPPDNALGWVMSGLQWASDGPSREVPCLRGESSTNRAPSMPVALTGLVLQALTAALVLVPGRWLAARRLRTSPGSS
ncbi:hypothetical protein EU811_01520 [Arthrobacter sp. TS-15]|uniref:hypothetical protein n=1 Tax=Arthrobacter sp. TS-15 TaxID=2510797 RepID=UPI00115E1D9E|nr:hypothetical protein [Arthrobacter sp. TS-15]TQS93897.1 hypothetical protein EU811_01520 [Arthrobacter sp. TS-15]